MGFKNSINTFNLDRSIKIDIYDVSKIKAKMPNTIMFGELNTFVGQ